MIKLYKAFSISLCYILQRKHSVFSSMWGMVGECEITLSWRMGLLLESLLVTWFCPFGSVPKHLWNFLLNFAYSVWFLHVWKGSGWAYLPKEILFSMVILSKVRVEPGIQFGICISNLLLVVWHSSDPSGLHQMSLLEAYLLPSSPHNIRCLEPLSFSTTKASSEAFS